MENWKQKNLKFSLQGSFLNLKAGNALMQVFPNGRIIVTDTKNREKAVALFNEFIEPKFITKSIKRGN
jgi:ArsR family metal-binding transcriptional regulator